MQGFRVGIPKLEFDVLAVGLDGFAADAKFFRNLTGAMPSRDEREHCRLAIAEDIETG